MAQIDREKVRVAIEEIWGTLRACAAEVDIASPHLSQILSGKYPVPSALLELIASKGYSVDPFFGIGEGGMVAEDPVSYCAERLSDSDILGILQKRLAAK